jgi:hypothetical protein
MDLITTFKNIIQLHDVQLDNVLNSQEITELLTNLNILHLLHETAILFKVYLNKQLNNVLFTPRRISFYSIGHFLESNYYVYRGTEKDINYKFSLSTTIDYKAIIYLAAFEVLYVKFVLRLASTKITSDKDRFLYNEIQYQLRFIIHTSESINYLIKELFYSNTPFLIQPINDKNITEYINNDDIISQEANLLPTELINKLKQIAEERAKTKFRPGGIGAREAEDEFDRRNGKLTKECDISYAELENKAKLFLETTNLINVCQAITQFANLIELEGSCDQYSIEDLKDVIKQLIKILAKTNLCLLIKLLKK